MEAASGCREKLPGAAAAIDRWLACLHSENLVWSKHRVSAVPARTQRRKNSGVREPAARELPPSARRWAASGAAAAIAPEGRPPASGASAGLVLLKPPMATESRPELSCRCIDTTCVISWAVSISLPASIAEVAVMGLTAIAVMGVTANIDGATLERFKI